MSTLKYVKSGNQNATHEHSHAPSSHRPALLESQTVLPEDAYPQSVRAGKMILVPQVQSMKDYVILHYKEALCAALCTWLHDNPSFTKQAELFTDTFCILAMSFWRDTVSTMTAHIRMSIDMAASEDGADFIDRQEYWAEVLFDMESGVAWKTGIFSAWEHEAPEGWMLSDYLIPILRKDEIEEGAEALLRRLYPKAIADPKENDAFRLAECMGLEVMRLPLHNQKRTRSILFFHAGTVTVKDEQSDEEKDKPPHAVEIPPNTIVINTNAVHKDYCQLDVYHECIHYDWHFMFYRLQDMHSNDVRQLKMIREVKRFRENRRNPLTWMEWQARRGAFGLMMPLCFMNPLVRKRLKELDGYKLHMGEKMDRLARGIAGEYDLPKFRVRARLIQMGFVAARGALNYVDERYIEPFAFSLENGMGDYSFVIDRQSAFIEYERNHDFRERIGSGQYVFADGHLCLNQPQYVTQTAKGLRLTKWANAHVDECCLRFVSVYEQSETAEYCFGALNSDEEYNNHYLMFLGEALTRQEQLTAMNRMINSLPHTFYETLEHLMRMRKITIEQLEEKAFLSARTISRLRTEERREYSLDQVIALCIALALPPWLSCEMLTRAGFTLRSTPLHRAYRFVLDCMFMDTVEDVQRFLTSSGQPPLNLKASA